MRINLLIINIGYENNDKVAVKWQLNQQFSREFSSQSASTDI